MNPIRRFGPSIALMLGGIVLGAALVWALTYTPHREPPSPPIVPATVPKILKENQINVITLTAEAVERLAIRTAKVERKPVRRTREYGGEVILPPGQTIVVSAPLAGTLRASEKGFPVSGQSVKKGEVVVELLPLLSPEGLVNLTAAKIEAEGQVASAQTQLEAGKVVLERAKRLLASDAGSKKAVEDATAQVDLAQKTLDAAQARRALLQRVVGELDKGTAQPLAIEAPQAGILRSVTALPGQSVPSGAALFEIIDPQRVWIKTPVYVGDLPELDLQAHATVRPLGVRAGEKGPAKGQAAKRASAPPSADPAAGTVDLFFELDNRTSQYSPGHRVSVELSQESAKVSLTVPWDAVLYDIHGGTWVYEQVAERQFARQRVSVRYVQDGTAVLAAGPAVGARVVVAGAAELFGTETGFSK